MIKKIKGLVTKVITVVNTKAVRGILIVSCLCVAALALLAVPMHTAGPHSLLYAMVACCALSSSLSLVQTYDRTKKKREDAADEV